MRLYKHDLDSVNELQENVTIALGHNPDVYAQEITIDLWSRNEYRIGVLLWDGEQWAFEPHEVQHNDGSITESTDG